MILQKIAIYLFIFINILNNGGFSNKKYFLIAIQYAMASLIYISKNDVLIKKKYLSRQLILPILK